MGMNECVTLASLVLAYIVLSVKEACAVKYICRNGKIIGFEMGFNSMLSYSFIFLVYF